ncbi:transglycosylase family protein [Paraconexibacter sp.]|uniref:transglycosylase family protein n=1 Tax=Paraconexibacter sp. TaxID=2949640 RepID=UPI003566711C
MIAAIALGAVIVPAGNAQDADALRQEIEQRERRDARLGSQAERLGVLERRISGQVALLQRRLDVAQREFDAAQGRLARTKEELGTERARALRLRRRLQEAREVLATQLEANYKASAPDMVTVVLNSDGFADLIERREFFRRVRRNNTEILDVVRDARKDAKGEVRRLARLERRRATLADAVERRRNALAAITSAAQTRREAVAEARAARLALRRANATARKRAGRTLKKLLAEQAKARVSNVGPGGPWAIPWAIVQCESGGQNLPPNSAGASGYYQFIPSTWKGVGGSTPHAYLASKAEQDRLAAKLWAGGSGARNWDCAAIVGLL